MKIGFYCESPADQAALAVFVEGILGEPPEPINMDIEGHGVTGVLSTLDGVIRGVYYNSDADGLVIVVGGERHRIAQQRNLRCCKLAERCRMCQLRKIIAGPESVEGHTRAYCLEGVAVGLTVPAIEAWYLVGKNHEVGEALLDCPVVRRNRRPFTSQLKQEIYGTERPQSGWRRSVL